MLSLIDEIFSHWLDTITIIGILMDEERESPRDWGKVGDGAVIAGQVFVPLRSS